MPAPPAGEDGRKDMELNETQTQIPTEEGGVC